MLDTAGTDVGMVQIRDIFWPGMKALSNLSPNVHLSLKLDYDVAASFPSSRNRYASLES
jgi:hypothetical protein